MTTLRKEIETLMKVNQREVDGHFFTVPSPERYPFQWLWDSCFHAIIYRRLGKHELAQQELLSACAKQWESGLLPHINFWHDVGTSLPAWGRELAGDSINEIFNFNDASGMTQPPLVARVALDTYQETRDKNFLGAIYPALVQFFDYLKTERRYDESSLLFIINPDESGEDNSPRYDNRLDLPAQHSALFHFEKRTGLMDKLVACEYETKVCMRQHFAVVDVGFNCIYIDGLQAMAEIAETLDRDDEARQFITLKETVMSDMKSRLKGSDGFYYSLDADTGELISTATWNIFMPLFAGVLTDVEASQLVKELQNPATFWSENGVRTTSKAEPSYDARNGFWRGPIWFAPHWFIVKGLQKYGFDSVAKEVTEKTVNLLETKGFREHYNPETGDGDGAEGFTWGGLVLDM